MLEAEMDYMCVIVIFPKMNYVRHGLRTCILALKNGLRGRILKLLRVIRLRISDFLGTYDYTNLKLLKLENGLKYPKLW